MKTSYKDNINVTYGGIHYTAINNCEIKDFVKSVMIDMFLNRAVVDCELIWKGTKLIIDDINQESVESLILELQSISLPKE
jgi:hypothetical protein